MTEVPTKQASRSLRPALLLPAAILIVVGILLVAAFAPLIQQLSDPPNERPEVATAIYDAVAEPGEGGTVDIGAVTDFEWDRMYAFPAYTDDDRVSEKMGIPWGTGAVARIPSEQFVLITFALGDEVTGWTILNDYDSTSPHVYFSNGLYENPIPRGDAAFRVDDFTLERI